MSEGICKCFPYSHIAECDEIYTRLFAYVPGNPNGSNTQQRLNVMQDWSAKKLEAALPAWYKRHRATWLIKPFEPDLRMHLPDYRSRFCASRTAEDFRGLYSDMTTAEYVAVWNQARGYKGLS